MLRNDKISYDIIIVGAGFGGLICGCFLAKAGLRVLVIEQHSKPGGYCTSFKRKGFIFDAAAHSFGGYKFGNLGRIFKDIGVDELVKIKRSDPSDIIVTPDHKFYFWADIEKTIDSFQRFFPNESGAIRSFFLSLTDPEALSFTRMRHWTFSDFLDQYFKHNDLKSILSFPLFGNGGLPPSRMSAFIGCKIFREFLLDGGYYPEGGMQELSDALAKIFKKFGGELRLASYVKKIEIEGNKVTGVVLENGVFIQSQSVVSNCDARQTFLELLGKNNIDSDFYDRLENMVPSTSMFIVYFGIDNDLSRSLQRRINVWVLDQPDLDKIFHIASKGPIEKTGGYLLHLSPEKRTVTAFINTAFRNDNFWLENKDRLTDFFLKKIEMDFIPKLSEHVVYREAATPETLYRYTRNYQGAAFGWEHSPSQLADSKFKTPSFIRGLYLTGHWTTSGLGIPGVTYLGWDMANLILKRKKRIKNAIIQ